MNKLIIGILAGIIILGGLWFFVLRDTDAPDTTDTANTSDTQSGSTTDTDTETPADTDETPAADSVTIVYTNSGFSPRDYRIKMGGTVTVRNDSDEVLDFASDDHPVHTDNSELNAGEISPGETKSFTVDRTGTWGFHNHERDSHTGTIVVAS